MRARPIALLLVSLSLSASAASAAPIPGEERFGSVAAPSQQRTVTAGISVNQIGEDSFASLSLGTELVLEKVGVGLRVPLNFRVIDGDPEATGDLPGGIRGEDWDEGIDYLRVLRYIRYGQKRDPIYARLGELAADLGHGTILGRYLNNVDLDTYRLGLQVDVNRPEGGVETIVSDVGRLATDSDASNVRGARLHVRPWQFIDPESRLTMVATGFTVVSDGTAPQDLADSDDLDSQTVFGFDAEALVHSSETLDVLPYTDLNFIADAGWGWHLGTLMQLRPPIGLIFPIRLEYRLFASDYLPTYFSTFYELERHSFPLGASGGVPKAQAVDAADDSEVINGYLIDAGVDVWGAFQLGTILEGHEGVDPTLAAFLNVPALRIIQFKAYYTRTRITGTDDVLAFDDRSLVIAEGRYQMIPAVFLVGRLTRQWVRTEEAGVVSHEPVDTWGIGVEAVLEL